jgi:polyphosphate:AMP phosphotransferase
MVVFEGWAAAGKGTIVNEMIQALDPRGFIVFTTQEAKEDEFMRPFLWRFWIRIARRGRIAIFDRSWYNKLLVSLASKGAKIQDFHAVFDEVRSFERQVTDDGALIAKFFLHISKDEQKDRLEKLETDKVSSWRVSKEEWKEHHRYSKGLVAVEEVLRQTDTDHAPWTIVEANDKRFAVAKVMNTLITTLENQIDRKEQALARQAGTPDCANPAETVNCYGHKLQKKFNASVLAEVDLSKDLGEEKYRDKLRECQKRIRELGYLCYTNRIPAVAVFEGWDAAGKGGCIRRLTENMDHRGYTVIPIAAPNDEEKEFHYLWRFWKHIPKAGHITVFDRSWYGRVLVERVEGFCREDEWRRAYQEINEMEEQWQRFGAVVVKFWLHIDKDEQKGRFEERMASPEKQWKITGEDWRNREKWDMYETAVDEMFFRTSTVNAPWTIVEANSKYYARIKVLETMIKAIEDKLK